jgi:catechol 2,3-dioxygenase-like lactoylglutathione lyase family enzyme
MSDSQRPEAGRREQGPQLTDPAEEFDVPEGEYPPPPEELLDTDAHRGNAGPAHGSGDIDHVDIRVADVERSRAFYAAALAPLGWVARPAETDPSGGDEIGFGRTMGIQFAIHSPTSSPGQDTVTTGAHIAFSADDAKAVHEFHAAALANGGRDIGPPGPRMVYGAGYYGAFVLDPDGNNIEAVWHRAPS